MPEKLLVQREVDDWVRAWSIPDEVGTYPMGAVIPHGDPHLMGEENRIAFGRTAARTWHTLIVRSRPRSVVLLETPDSLRMPRNSSPAESPPEAQLLTGSLPQSNVPFDDALATQLLDSALGVERCESVPRGSSLATQLRFLAALAPGCPVLPLFLNEPTTDADPHGEAGHAFGQRLGHELLLDPDVLIVASSNLTRYGESYSFTPGGLGEGGHRWLRQNDARMIRFLRELAAEDIQQEARQNKNATGGTAIAAALAAAKVRGSTEGHLLEYTTSHQASSKEDLFNDGVGYVGVVF